MHVKVNRAVCEVLNALLTSIVIICACAAPCRADGEGAISEIARSSVMDLHMIPADIDRPRGERWIVWDERSRGNATTHIQLCTVKGECRWSHVWRDAYAPTIKLIGPWSSDSDEGPDIFLLTYQEGAVAETAVIIGYVRNKIPTIYAQRDGALISLMPDNNTLEIQLSPGPEQDMECLGWHSAVMRLKSVPCWKQPE